MDTQLILSFLADIATNNNRPWFQEHKLEYLAAKADFEEGIAKAIGRLAVFDSKVAHISVKDTVYRFYRDTRFSADKSPYKRHLGAYICAYGKKSLYGGYYLHLEPSNCMLCIGSYYLPTNILTACRNEIMANIDVWREAVENPSFVQLFGRPEDIAPSSSPVEWPQYPKGFGLGHLKTVPKGFPRDYPFLPYLQLRDYCCWIKVSDDFFEGESWLDEMERIFKTGKPMMDFINNVIEDYI